MARDSLRRTNPDIDYQASKVDILAKRRNCTDIICLILFIIFIFVHIGVSVFAYLSGDPKQLVLPHDSEGRTCVDPSPNLFFFDLAKCVNINALLTGCNTPQVCVSECPTSDLYYLIDSHRKLLISKYCKLDKIISKYGGIPLSISQSEYYQLNQQNICPLYVLSSKPLFDRCLPSIITDAVNTVQYVVNVTDTSTNATYPIYDNSTNKPLTTQLLSDGVNYITKLLNIKTVGQFVLEDFVHSAVLIIVLLLIGAVVSFIYIIITRWIVGPMIAIALVGIVALLSFGTYFCIDRYIQLRNNTESQQGFQLKLDFNYYLQLSSTWLAFGIIAGIVLLIILLLILVLLKRLRLAIGLISEASKAVTGIFLIVLWPLVPFVLQMGLLAYNISVAVYLASAGKALYRVANGTNGSCCGNATYSIGDPCDPATFNNQSQDAQCVFYRFGYGNPFSAIKETNAVIDFLSNYQWLPQFFNLFMFYWFQMFIVGFNQMVLAGGFAIWYWSKSKKCCITCTSVKDTLVYHLGSIAFGSLLISIVKLIRAIIQFVENRVKSASGNHRATNCCIKFTFCCCKCCFWCLEKFLKFLNRNAYIMVAIYGKNFCSSARDALTLLASNPLRALVLDSVTDFILFLGKVLITTGVGILSFYFFTKKFYVDPNWAKYFAPDLHYYWLPIIIIIFGTYFIAKIFFTVFDMAVDTIFLCALKDLEVNDGTPEKPYCMSKELRKLLHVKNTEPTKIKKKSTVNPAYDEEDGNKKESTKNGKPSAPPQMPPTGSNYYQYHETFSHY